MSTSEWHALHVHRHERQDEFLVDGLAPALTSVESFFFLRYWQGGPHLRVRVLLDSGLAEPALDQLTERLSGYLASRPAGDFDVEGFRQAQVTMAELESSDAEEIYPGDTIRRVPYEPEYDKYGGTEGVAIAERLFAASSRVVLDLLGDVAGRSPARLGAGLSMMVRGLCAAGFTAEAMAGFFAHYCVLWSPYVFTRFLDAWPDLLKERQEATRAHVEALLSHAGELRDDPFAAAVATAWSSVSEAAEVVLPQVVLAGADASRQSRERVLMASYLHTHNNRLGLIPEQEAFLGFLGHHVLSACAGRPPASDLIESVRRHREARLGAYASY
ncbi:thiopeptide-type bacteriocin biosynthesis protein [Nonomuraea sp. NPDC046802]|uniref:thiopeptide-type bacteriocin biosynthesis protein n=1 Tax=Nonomuraea sp. NPDC046802 TaxID=3154919 RepID=UPI0033E16226